eukprot:TRINITY_DN8569_c0_g1_i1.p1 TRINITY_DN8569_c0_g1~~TRINITY_DN8569_c0_g1_i1.p1  ORF type:complete len:105 (-),score=14.72 TRINITY_DN8569_c0_g1_i1:105-419(-)
MRHFGRFGKIERLQAFLTQSYALIRYESVSHADAAVNVTEREPFFENKAIKAYKPELPQETKWLDDTSHREPAFGRGGGGFGQVADAFHEEMHSGRSITSYDDL